MDPSSVVEKGCWQTEYPTDWLDCQEKKPIVTLQLIVRRQLLPQVNLLAVYVWSFLFRILS